MRRLDVLVSVGVTLVILGCSLYFLFPYKPEERMDFPSQNFILGEPPWYIKATKIEEWLGDYGGEYHFQITGLKFGDSITVEVYVDGKLEDKFVEVTGIGWKEYIGNERIAVYITAVKYANVDEQRLSFTLDSYRIRYGGRPIPLLTIVLSIAFGGVLTALGLVFRKRTTVCQ